MGLLKNFFITGERLAMKLKLDADGKLRRNEVGVRYGGFDQPPKLKRIEGAGRVASFEDWTAEDRIRLERFFIVGAGTWQNLCYENSLVLGFDPVDEVNLTDKLMEQKQIPDEILFRFPHLVELKGLSTSDFKQWIGQVRTELNLPVLSKDSLAKLAFEAVKSRRQNRWLEQYVVRALRERTCPQ